MIRARVVARENKRRPPAAPAWLSVAGKREWRSLWRAGVSTLWEDEDDKETVARLAYLRATFKSKSVNVDTAARLHVQIRALEADLYLTPRARDLAEIEVAKEVVAEQAAPPAATASVKDRHKRAAKRAAAAAAPNN